MIPAVSRSILENVISSHKSSRSDLLSQSITEFLEIEQDNYRVKKSYLKNFESKTQNKKKPDNRAL